MTKEIYIWDRFVRVFHWSLVGLFVASYLTGDDQETIHAYCGYAIAVLLVMRLIWGFWGTEYARFNEFVYSPATVIHYLKTMVSGAPRRYLGHNPAAGAMILVMLLTLALITISGMKLYAVEEGKGPFSVGTEMTLINVARADSGEYEFDDEETESGYGRGYREREEKEEEEVSGGREIREDERESEGREEEEEDEDEDEEFWEEIHEATVNFMLFLLVVHLGGVFVSGRQHNEALVRSMITGRKRQDDDGAGPRAGSR